MVPEQWERIKELFDSALDLPAPGRKEYLAQACADDPTVLSEVERLLRAHEQAGDFLSRSAIQPGLSLSEGELIANKYRVIRMLGRGGMGEVYEVEDEFLHTRVALKTLRPDLALDDGYLRRFRREIQLAYKVTHPNVCRVYDVGEHIFPDSARTPIQFFTMEFLAGETLSSRIHRSKRLCRDEAFPLAVQMAEGLNAAHEAGIVHTDFKSGNVMLCPGLKADRAVVTDFGLARFDPSKSSPDQLETLSAALQLAGTLGYMSPEQLTGGKITTASDIYSFGIVLYEMATGALPFDNRNPINGAVQRMAARTVSAKGVVPNIDPNWDAAISRCLQPDAGRRFRSARDLADCFQSGSWRVPPVYWSRRRWTGAAVAFGIPLVSGAAYWTWSRRPYQPLTPALDWYRKGVAAMHSMTYDSARKALEQAVAADPRFALAQATLARAYEELDQIDLARESMLNAVGVAADSRLSGADTQRLRALQFLVSRDYDRAAPLYQSLEDDADASQKAAAALETGWVAQLREKTDEAAATYERAVAVDPRYAAAKLRLGFVQGRRRQLDEALKTFSEAEALYDAASDYEGVTETLLERASLLNRSSRAREAGPVIEKALSVARTLKNQSQQIRLQLLEGVAARNLGDTARAAQLAQQAIDAATAQKMENIATSGLTDLGNAFLAKGENQPAEKYFQQALDFARRSKARRNEARASLALGAFYEYTKRTADAARFIQAALPFYRQAGYRREFVQATLVLGSVQDQEADYAAAVATLRETLTAARNLHDNQLEGQTRERLAGALQSQGAWPEALEQFEAAARLLRSGSQTPALLSQAAICADLGRREDAQHLVKEVERILRQTPNPAFAFGLRLRKTKMAYSEGRWAEAAAEAHEILQGGERVTESARQDALLVLALIRVRTVGGSADARNLALALARFDQAKSSARVAASQLLAAEVLLITGALGDARRTAEQALAFFERSMVWEPIFRGHLITAKACEGAQSESHRQRAGAALGQMRSLWSNAAVERYLQRPDIKKLADGIRL